MVVGASPNALRRVPVDLDDLGFENERGLGPVPSFRPFAAYGRTKNMNVMFVYGLARRLEGTNITVNGAHPGIIKGTGLGRGASRGLLGISGRFFVQRRQVTTAPHTTDIPRCDRLWDESARLVGLPPEL